MSQPVPRNMQAVIDYIKMFMKENYRAEPCEHWIHDKEQGILVNRFQYANHNKEELFDFITTCHETSHEVNIYLEHNGFKLPKKLDVLLDIHRK